MTAEAPTWKQAPERGSVFALRLLIWLDRLLGRRATGWLLWGIAAYYVATAGAVRRASASYLRRVGHDAGLSSIIRHVWTFARVALDRALFATGQTECFEIELHGREHIEGARGVLVLGAHLGSFEALQAISRGSGLSLCIIADERNARSMAAVLESLAPRSSVRFVGLDEQHPEALLTVQARVEAGDVGALLADRVTQAKDRRVSVPFLGEPAWLPAGPYLLAHLLRCPVFFSVALFHPPNRYDIYCEPLAERIELNRATRQADLERWARAYAERLEAYARQAPLNWFNFFDFWKP